MSFSLQYFAKFCSNSNTSSSSVIKDYRNDEVSIIRCYHG